MQKLEHQSLARGITVLETLARNGSCSLAEIHRHTQISKSSIRRLLATLVERRLVRKSLADGQYRIIITLPVGAGEPVPVKQAFAVDVALPHVVELTKSVSWPSDIQVLDGDRMRVLDSTRPLSPFHLYRGVVNRQVNIFGSAAGMVCLAQMEPSVVEKILAHTKGDTRWGLVRFKLDIGEYKEILEKTRLRTYGVRIIGATGYTDFDDGLSAIALPIYHNAKLFGAVSMLWPKSYLGDVEFAKKYLSALQDTTNAISEDLDSYISSEI